MVASINTICKKTLMMGRGSEMAFKPNGLLINTEMPMQMPASRATKKTIITAKASTVPKAWLAALSE